MNRNFPSLLCLKLEKVKEFIVSIRGRPYGFLVTQQLKPTERSGTGIPCEELCTIIQIPG